VASRPEFAPALRQILIGLLIILMLRFRPQGILPDRPNFDPDGSRQPRGGLVGLLRRRGDTGDTGDARPGTEGADAATAGPTSDPSQALSESAHPGAAHRPDHRSRGSETFLPGQS